MPGITMPPLRVDLDGALRRLRPVPDRRDPLADDQDVAVGQHGLPVVHGQDGAAPQTGPAGPARPLAGGSAWLICWLLGHVGRRWRTAVRAAIMRPSWVTFAGARGSSRVPALSFGPGLPRQARCPQGGHAGAGRATLRPWPAVTTTPNFIEAIARGLDVIKAFEPHRPAMSLTEVAAAAALARPTARRILLTLTSLGYVRSTAGGFALTPRVLDLGMTYVQAMGLWDVARPHMELLVSRTGESTLDRAARRVRHRLRRAGGRAEDHRLESEHRHQVPRRRRPRSARSCSPA